MAIGRMIRARHLDVAIGRTYYGGCGPADSACKLGKGEVARGDAISSWGICASACPLRRQASSLSRATTQSRGSVNRSLTPDT